MKQNWRKLILIILPVIAAVYVLYPTWQANDYEKLWETAKFDARQKSNPADSIAVIEKFKDNYGEDFEAAKQKRIKLGLDLRGGMYVTLEVDVIKLIEESAQKDAVDDTFEKVIAATKEELITSDEEAIPVFLKYFDEIARKEGKSLISYFDIGDIRNASEEAIIENLENDALSAVQQAQEVIRQRIDKYGVSEPNIQQQGTRRILVELPGVSNEEEVRQLISTTARLEFNIVRNNEKIVRGFKAIDEYLSKREGLFGEEIAPEMPAKVAEVASTTTTESSSTSTDDLAADESGTLSADQTPASSTSPDNPYEGLEEEDARNLYKSRHKFTSLFATFFIPGENQDAVQYDYEVAAPAGEYYFMISEDDIDKFNAYLRIPELNKLLPFNLKVGIEAKPVRNNTETKNFVYRFHAFEKEPELVGDVITNAAKNIDPTTNSWVVNMQMNTEGAEKWSKITGANVGNQIAILLDDRIYSAPNVISKISGGNSQITGMANATEANLLEIVLKAGALKAPVKIIEERVVGASLGEDSISKGVNSSLFAFALIIAFMIFYYARGGMVADLALLINVALIFTVLGSLGGTLTLPGIAGIILTMGMAVDANILIFERIREELYKGRTLKSAIDEGFKKAMSAIIDSNITSFITGMILFYFGTGMIQGFALTLMVGILSTLFTAIMVSRALIEIQMKGSEFSFGQPKESSL